MAPGLARAQRVATTEFAVGAAGVIATRDFWGGEMGLAWGADGRRLAAAVAGGSGGGAAAARVGATAQFLLRPRARSGTSPYAGIGLAWTGAEDTHGAAYLAVLLGVEAAPAKTRGWYVEIGLEGGVRVAAGLRWRRFKVGK